MNKSVENQAAKICSFKPTRTNQEACTGAVVVSYGTVVYCSKHQRSVQALSAKKRHEDEERERQEANLYLEDVAPIPVPGPALTNSVMKTPTGKTITKKKITPNAWGRFEDVDTKIVFDPMTKMAYGSQDYNTGKVVGLSDKQIAICKRYKWKYYIPRDEDDLCAECGKQLCDCEDEGDEAEEGEDDEAEEEEGEWEEGEEDDEEEEEEGEWEEGEEEEEGEWEEGEEDDEAEEEDEEDW